MLTGRVGHNHHCIARTSRWATLARKGGAAFQREEGKLPARVGSGGEIPIFPTTYRRTRNARAHPNVVRAHAGRALTYPPCSARRWRHVLAQVDVFGATALALGTLSRSNVFHLVSIARPLGRPHARTSTQRASMQQTKRAHTHAHATNEQGA